jgi:hypothetical protein
LIDADSFEAWIEQREQLVAICCSVWLLLVP